MMEELFSVIIPVYNVSNKLLERCVDSVIKQSYKNIEIIIVDDGSKKEIAEKCDSYLLVDRRIKVIHQNNKGLCGARNIGQINSNGTWIMFLDGDDWIEKNTIETIKKNIVKNIDIICFDFYTDLPNKVLRSNHKNFISYGKIYSTEGELKFIKKMCLNFYAECCSSWCKAYRKDFLTYNNLFHDEKLKQGAEDIDFSYRVFSCECQMMFIEEYLYHYMFNSDSITRKFIENNQYLAVDCLNKVRKMINDNDEEMLIYFYSKLIQVVIASGINGYFSVSNPNKYKIQKKMYLTYLDQEIIKEAFDCKYSLKLDCKRKIIAKLIKRKICFPLLILSKIKYRRGGI